MDAKPLFVFPKWSNQVALGVVVVLLTAPAYLGALVAYAFNPTTLNVGYEPVQPIPYSHALHVGQMGIDCRYCHNTVEKAGFAAIPPTDTCLNCHNGIWTNSPKLKPLFESARTGEPVKWVKIHDLPNYVFFNHSAHVNGGVGCVECHGRVNHMETVSQVQPLNMGWCLECHRDPDPRIRPKDQVTNLEWAPAVAEGKTLEQAKRELGAELKKKFKVQPNVDCVTCHR